MNQIRKFCDAGIVLEMGKMQYFEDLEEAIALHEATLS
jgi:capsular polysaccharide transport system ATP-binding protein